MDSPGLQSETSQARALRVLEFEGLRGFLSWWIVIDHLLLACGFSTETLPRGVRLLTRGDYAVDVFIILSGFVIFNLLHDAREPYFVFLTRRFFRLYPVYIICLLLSVAMLPLNYDNFQHWTELPMIQNFLRNWHNDTSHLGSHLLAHFTLLHGAVPDDILRGSSTAILGPAWSISLEWQFYLVVPLLCLFLRGYGFKGWMVFGVGAVILTWLSQKWLEPHFTMNAFLPEKILMFWIGIISFHLWREYRGPGNLPAMIFAGFCPLILFFTLSIPLTIWAAVMAVSMSGGQGTGSRVASFLILPGVQKLGRISYSTYLVHMCCITLLQWLIFKCLPGAGRMQMLCLLLPSCAAATYFVSCAMHRFIEVPGMRLGRRLTMR